MNSVVDDILPNGWENTTIEETCEVLDRLRKPISQKDRKRGKYPYYGATKIVDYINDFIFDERLVLVGEDGAKWERGDKTGFIAEGKYWVNNHAHVLRVDKDVLIDKWLVNFLDVTDLSDYITGTTVPKLNQAKLKSINFPLPPIEEQKRIVAKIDGLFAKIDKAISLTEKSLVQAKNLLPSIIDETFDSFDAEKVDLKSISESIQYGYTGKTIENGQYYYLRITDIQGGVVNYQAAPYSDIKGINIEKYKLNKGDILFARTGATAGKSYLFNDDVEAVFASYLIRVVCNQGIVRPSFVKWFFLSANYWKQIYGNIIGAAQPNFNGKKLGELNLKIPSLEQQELVIGYLEKVSKQTKETQSKLKNQLAYLKQLKSSILSKAFKGEL